MPSKKETNFIFASIFTMNLKLLLDQYFIGDQSKVNFKFTGDEVEF